MAEELRLEQGFRDAAAVDGDEGSANAPALGVNQLRDHFLADPGLTQNQDLRLRSGGRLDISAKLDERWTLAEK